MCVQPFPVPTTRCEDALPVITPLPPADSWRGVQALPWLGGQPPAAELFAQLLPLSVAGLNSGKDGMVEALSRLNNGRGAEGVSELGVIVGKEVLTFMVLPLLIITFATFFASRWPWDMRW